MPGATARVINPFSTAEAILKLLPRIEGYWADAEGKKIESKPVELGNTVYFHINTRGAANGTQMEFQLFRRTTISGRTEDMFDGKTVKHSFTIQNNKAVIELELPESWEQTIRNNGKNRDGDGRFMPLHWRVSSQRRLFKSDELRVKYVENEIFIKPSPLDNGLPELFLSTGEQLVLLVTTLLGDDVINPIIDNVRRAGETALCNQSHQYALGKLEQGYLIDNTRRVHTGTTARGTARQLEDVSFITRDGRYVETKQGYEIFTKRKDGQIITTRSVNQYEYQHTQHYNANHLNQKGATKVKVLRSLSYFGHALNAFEVFSMAAGLDHSKPLPMPFIPGADVLGRMAYDQFQEWDRIMEDVNETRRQNILKEAKPEGIDKVRDVINNRGNRYREFQGAGYRTLSISPEIATQLMNEELMKIADLYEAADNAKESERNNHILFRDTVHPTAGYPIIIIESFFIDEE